jgi:hypothetical protein
MAPPASSGPDAPAPLAGLAQIVVLALWIGAATFFSVVVAPAAFGTLPTRELAGAVVGRILPDIFMSGVVVALMALGLEVAWGTRRYRAGRIAAMGVTALACGIAQFGVAPRIAALRDSLQAPLASLATDAPQRIAFGRLHMLSVAWLGLALVAGGVTIVLAVLTLRSRTPR